MIEKIIKFPLTVLRFMLSAHKSRYKGIEKFQVFSILLSLWLKANWLKGRNKVCNQVIFGYTVKGYNYETILSLFKEIFLLEVYFFSTANDKPTIIDCGANIGLSILYFKKLFPNAEIFAFEPDPEAFDLLKTNILLNHLEGVSIYNIGLYNGEGSLPFYLGSEKASLIGSFQQNSTEQQPISVEVKRLSGYLFNFEAVDLVKIDVEGAETNILQDLSENNLIGKANQYIIEYHHKLEGGKVSLSRFLLAFEENKFNYYIKQSLPVYENKQESVLHFYKNGSQQ